MESISSYQKSQIRKNQKASKNKTTNWKTNLIRKQREKTIEKPKLDFDSPCCKQRNCIDFI